jgi:hypothetical protein
MIRAEAGQQLQLRGARSLGALVSQVDNLALRRSVDCAMRLVDEVIRAPLDRHD